MNFLDERYFLLALLAASGVLTGIINTIAGGGSFLTLPLLIALGLPAGVANGTVRIGILLQNVVATTTFHRRGVREYSTLQRLLAPIVVGAASGAYCATLLADDVLRPLFGVMFLLWASVMVFRPGRFIQPKESPSAPAPVHYAIAVLIGFYGGFMQAGVGFPLIGLLVLGLGFAPVAANSIKVGLILVFTGFAAVIFAIAGDIAWYEGGILATGSMLGGYLGTRWQIKSGAVLVRWFVIVMMGVSGIMMIVA